jgi:hypothetical protein
VINIREESRIHYQDLKDDLRGIKAEKAEKAKGQAKKELLDWVSQVDYSSNFYASLSSTINDDTTGDWSMVSHSKTGSSILAQEDCFSLEPVNFPQHPIQSPLNSLRIAGLGKIVICSKAIRHLLQNDTIQLHSPMIAYFFFDFNDIAKQSIEDMVRSLVFQLIAQLDEIPDDLRKLHSKQRSSVPTLQVWCSILKSCLKSAKTRYIFIDALDECGEGEAHLLAETLYSLFGDTQMATNWFLTCRPSQ